ncbi:flagellar protein FlgN [Bacillus sp. V3B]|uniref:flagellar protein FlgN n=1 Tax=Bacillus sp. V3B TaxID=2804915 RepID=UPI00210BFCE5|nr:flagellar protein FlgN [Bacillus sp. V3B]MCQ6277133.1 flagellar protein FlgN [Bacillus sp. V3B]
MLTKNIITSLEKLISLHEELFDKSKIKTEIIKKGDVEALKSITNDERNDLKLIHAAQKDLMSDAKNFLQYHSISIDQPTLRDCLQHVKEQDQQTLTTLQLQLVEKVSLFKKQNDLNQQLLEQSLAFVQMSIDLLTPDIDTYNYERPDRNQPYEPHGRSLFDSNA